MAGLTKTYSGDFAGFIAGKIWDVIKDVDEKRRIEKTNASKEVKDAAKKLLKDDPNSVPVKDKNLKDTISKIFLPLESKLLQTKSNVDGMSAKVTSIAAGVADTQNLIINQNQILEDKLDVMLSVLENKNRALDKLNEDNQFDRIEGILEKGVGVTGNSGLLESTAGGSGIGTLSGFLGKAFADRIFRSTSKFLRRRILPRRLRAGGRLLRMKGNRLMRPVTRRLSSLRPRNLMKKGVKKFATSGIGKKLTSKLGAKAATKIGGKAVGKSVAKKVPILGALLGTGFAIQRLMSGDPLGAGLEFASGIASIFPGVGTGISVGLDVALAARDISGESVPKMEMGSGHISPASIGLGGIQEIVGATLAIGKAAGIDTKILVSDAGLGSVEPKGTYNFDLNPTGGGKTIATQTKMVEDRELPKIRKLKEEKKKNDKDKGNGEGDDNNNQSDKSEYNGGRPRWQRMLDPFQMLSKDKPSGEGGNSVGALDSMLTAQHSPVKIDASGESGVDFTPEGPNNRAAFDGYVSDIGHQYNPNVTGGDGRQGAGYGHYIGITSVDSKTGQEFEGVYAHFPEGELDRWSIGDTVKYGDILGRMGTWSDYANPSTRWHVGSGTGPHTSLDFFVPGTNQPYPHWRSLVPRIDPTFSSKPNLLPPPLPPIDSNISATLSPHTNLVNKGSSERLIAKRQASVSSPIVMVNNTVMQANSSPIVMSSGGSEFSVKDIQYARLAS